MRRVTRSTLPTRSIGSLDVTAIGLGCNNFGARIDAAATEAVVDAALEAGINFFDTADVYGNGGDSEKLLGGALEGRRDRAIVATKFGMAVPGIEGGARPEYVRKAAEASLSRLGTDYIDLYQIHRPDPEVPIVETLGALNQLVSEGLVREIGCSNFDAGQLREAEAAAGDGARFVSVQNEYSMLHRDPEDGVLDECARLGVGFLPYFPLYSGILTGKYRRGRPLPEGTRVTGNPRWQDRLTDDLLDRIEALVELAAEQDLELVDLAFVWLLARPQVSSVIAGATSPAQVRRNASTAEVALSRETMARIEVILAAPA